MEERPGRRQDGQVADRHGRQGQRRRRRLRQADRRLGRLRRAGLRAAEQLHDRGREEQGRAVHRADARGDVGRRRGRRGPRATCKFSTIDAPGAKPTRSRRYVPARLPGPVQGGHQGRERASSSRAGSTTRSGDGQEVAPRAPVRAAARRDQAEGAGQGRRAAVQRRGDRRAARPWKPGALSATAAAARHSSGRRAARAADPLLQWVLTGLAAVVLLLIAFFFIRLFIEAKPAFAQVRLLGFVFDNDWDVSKDIFGALAAAGRARSSRRRSRWSSACRSRRHGALHHRAVPAPAAPPLTVLVELLAAVPSVVYGLWGIFVLAPKLKPAEQWFSDTFSFLPFVGGTVADPELLHRRADPGDHDPADRLRDLARGHRDRAARAQGGGARARRDALGDDPDGRPAVLARRHLGRRDARPRPGDRRDDRRDASSSATRRRSATPSSPRATRWPRSSPTSSARRRPTRPTARRSSPPASCCSSSRSSSTPSPATTSTARSARGERTRPDRGWPDDHARPGQRPPPAHRPFMRGLPLALTRWSRSCRWSSIIYYLHQGGDRRLERRLLHHRPDRPLPRRPGRHQVARSSGTIVIVALASAIAIPIGIGVALYLVEYGKGSHVRQRRALLRRRDDRRAVDRLRPVRLHRARRLARSAATFAAWKGSVALALLMLPVVTRAAEVVLNLVPDSAARRRARARRAALAGRLPHRAADGAARPRHRLAARGRPRRGRDGAAAVHRRVRPRHAVRPRRSG